MTFAENPPNHRWSMWGSFKKLNCILDRKDYLSLARLLVFVAVAAILEVMGIFSILPFMQLVSDPESIESNRWLSWIQSTFQFDSRKALVTCVGFAVLVIYAMTAVANVLTYWIISRTVWGIAHRIAMRMLNRYARLPYEFYLTNNSAELIKKVISDIHALVSGVLMASCQFFASGLKSLVILLLLFFVNSKLALLAFVTYGGAYVAMHLARHKHLEILGIDRLETISLRIKSFTETLAGIKTLRVSGSTDMFVARFEQASKRFSNITPKFLLYSLIPQKAIEFLAFGGIVGIILYMLMNDIDLINVIPMLSVFALATYKLLPALSDAFSQAANLSHNLPVIDVVHEDMREDWQLLRPAQEYEAADPMSFQRSIKLRDVSYRYEAAGLPVLENVNLEIPKSSRCAFVGSTGCGKSTLLDIMVGLLFPASGELAVDSQALHVDNVFGWQKIIAYVPQDVFLYDDTVAANIALGISESEIDQELLRHAATLARIDEFIDADLPQGYETLVGERGVRLSGGQRQRIGLARAFYRQPQVLFLDEATSALDNVTEELIISAIDKQLPGVTVVMIAHRLSTVKFCDRIFMVDESKVVDVGTFDQLLDSNVKFRQMVEVSEG